MSLARGKGTQAEGIARTTALTQRKNVVCSSSKKRLWQIEFCKQRESMMRQGWGSGWGTTQQGLVNAGLNSENSERLLKDFKQMRTQEGIQSPTWEKGISPALVGHEDKFTN